MGGVKEIKLCANAKINLTLDIVGVRPDGYHLMDMVNKSINLADEITLKRSAKDGIKITSNARFLPRFEKNLAYKATMRLFEAAKLPLPNVEIDITKRIPTQAGLGGGSADAAATMVGLNELFSLGFSQSKLCEIGEAVGSDVPYCIVGGTAHVSGIGEIIEPIKDKTDFCLVVLMPRDGRSTKEAFSLFDSGTPCSRPDTKGMIDALAAGDNGRTAIQLCNVFQTISRDETTEELVSLLLSNGALGASLTGSGAAVFGIFPDMFSAKKCKTKLFPSGLRAYVARSEKSGVKIVYKK